MTVTVDTNVLVYASDEASAFHRPARRLVERLAAGPELLHLLWPVVLGYLRLTTHPAVFAHPLAPAEAMANVEALLARRHVRVSGEDDGFWEAYRAVAGELPVRGNVVPDAHLVALMHQHGIRRVLSRDRDLRRFSGIVVEDPFGR